MKKNVTVYYRKLDRDNCDFTSLTFEAAIANALNTVSDNWRDRSMETEKQSTVFTNLFNIMQQEVYGDLCAFSQSQMQALINTTDDGTDHSSVNVNEMRAPDDQDFLLGMAHWLVIDDHVLLVQGPHLYARQIQEYFDWLLRVATSTISGETPIPLTAVLDASEIGEPGDAQSIEIGGAVASNISPDLASRRADTTSRTEIFDATPEWAQDIYKMFFGAASLEQLNRELPNESQLKAKVTFNFSKLRKDIDVNALQGLSGALQDLPHSQVKIRGKQGIISGEDARLHMNMAINKVNPNGILLDPEDAQEVLQRVYRRFREDEKIH